MRTPINRHRLPQLAADLAIVVVAWFLAFRLRFDTTVPSYYERYLLGDPRPRRGGQAQIFALFGFYNRWWRYVSTRDMWGAARGVVAASLVTFLVFAFFDVHVVDVPRTVWVIDCLLTLALVGSRMLARTIIERPQTRSIVARGKEVIVVGAGDAGAADAEGDAAHARPRLHADRPDRRRPAQEEPAPARDPRARHDGGAAAPAPRPAPDELLIAIPSASSQARQRIVDVATAEGVTVKTLPGLHELIAGDLDLAGQIRPVQVEDLLGREPVEVDLDAIASYVAGKTVLVTGAGGSIGSELCRQLARAEPQRIVLVDQAESALHDIERELVDERRFVACVPVLADAQPRRPTRCSSATPPSSSTRPRTSTCR